MPTRRQRQVIFADSRENLPFVFRGHTVQRKCLKVGDYTIRGYGKKFAVERKGYGDFLNCIGSQWSKFMSDGGQVHRLSMLDFSLIVVEGTISRVNASCYQRFGVPEYTLIERVAEIALWVPIVLCGDRIKARDMTLQFLLKAKQEVDNEAYQRTDHAPS